MVLSGFIMPCRLCEVSLSKVEVWGVRGIVVEGLYAEMLGKPKHISYREMRNGVALQVDGAEALGGVVEEGLVGLVRAQGAVEQFAGEEFQVGEVLGCE